MSVQTDNAREEYLIELLASALNQREAILGRVRPSWGWIYKMSDYHHVSNLAYYKIMWVDDREARQWKEKFEDRYRNAMRQQEKNKELRRRIEEALEEAEVHAVFLGETTVLGYYPHPEMRMPEPVQVLVDKKRIAEARKVMGRLGLEESERQEETDGRLYVGFPGLRVELMDTLAFTEKKVRIWFEEFPKILPKPENRHYIHNMNEETQYIYFMCRIAEKYARGQIEIRDIVDLWLLVTAEGSKINWKEVRRELEKLDLEMFGEYIVKLAGKWFGRLYFRDDMDILSDIQTYIFTKGTEARRESELFLPLVKTVADNYHRDLKKEEKKKQREWSFPPLEYMKGTFPRLEKHPWLLPLYWMVRLARRRSFSRRNQTKEEEKEENGA